MVTDPRQLTAPEEKVLQAFREYLVKPGEMLCFNGPCLVQHQGGLQTLLDKQLVTRERFAGGYSLTPQGLQALRSLAVVKTTPAKSTSPRR